MNVLPIEKQVSIIGALVEGNSIRSTERMTGVHRDTIMRLGKRVGAACAKLMDEKMVKLPCRNVAVDELWCYVGKKQRHVQLGDDLNQVGDTWTFVAIDNETKLVPCYAIGKRDTATTIRFVQDLANRVENRIQLASDKFGAYLWAVQAAFGGKVDYGVVVKSYESEPTGPGRYSPPKVTEVRKEAVTGNPDIDTLSTSFIERQNLTMRMRMRRFTRLTNGFSKTREGLEGAVALHFGVYNFVTRHRTLGTTPAVEAGVEDRPWMIEDLVGMAG